MAEIELFFIGTSKIKEVRSGGQVSYEWGATSNWINFKSPSVNKATIKYKATLKNGHDAVKNATGWASGGVTRYGTTIPATASRTIDGVQRTCNVRYRMRKYFAYTRTKQQKKKGKCTKATYTYYSYQLQYQDKPVVDKEYSEYRDGKEFIFFGDHYFDDNGDQVNTSGHLPHPVDFQITYSDVRKNFESSANNSDSRDNKGSYVLSNVRANLVTIDLKWAGLSEEAGKELIDTLNPQKDTSGDYPYLTVQYRDMATGKAKNGTFFAGDRVVTKYSNGIYKEISVTLTEV